MIDAFNAIQDWLGEAWLDGNVALRSVALGLVLWPIVFVAYALFPNRGLGYVLAILPLVEAALMLVGYPLLTAAAVAFRPSRRVVGGIFLATAWEEVAGLACVFLPASRDPRLMAAIVAAVGMAILGRGTLRTMAGVAAIVLLAILFLGGRGQALNTVKEWAPITSSTQQLGTVKVTLRGDTPSESVDLTATPYWWVSGWCAKAVVNGDATNPLNTCGGKGVPGKVSSIYFLGESGKEVIIHRSATPYQG